MDLRARRLASLRQTWLHARERSRYWAEKLPALHEEQITFDRLAEIPVLSRNDLSAHRNAIRCQRGLPSYMVFTAGSTSLPQLIYGSEQDLAVRLPPSAQAGDKPHALSLGTDGGHHGAIPQIPGRMHFIQVPLRNKKNYQWAWDLLTGEHTFEGYDPKISSLLLPLPAVKRLTYYVLENKLDTSKLALKRIMTFAWHLSQGWRAMIERVLGARISDTFGFTEIPGAVGRECRACGNYHYGREAIWEIVNPETHARIDGEGVGKLLVTSLVPYTNDLVLFRYEAGDLVKVGPYCERGGEHGFRPLGRKSQSLFVNDEGTRRCVFHPSHVQEAIDTHHWIGRVRDLRFAGITAADDDGFPRWCARLVEGSVEGGVPTVEIDVEMKSDPNLFFDAFRSFELDLRAKLLAASSELKAMVERRALRLRIRGLAPGGLRDEEVFIC